MEASTSRLFQISGSLLRAPGDRKVAPRPRRFHVAGGVFADEGHLRYYALPVRCGKAKEEKRRMRLANDLSRDLSMLMSTGFGLEEETRGDQEKISISEAAEVLLSRLEQIREKEKNAKKNKRKEGECKKKMKNCDESSSSSESSQSSDSECEEEVINMGKLRSVVAADVTQVSSIAVSTTMFAADEMSNSIESALTASTEVCKAPNHATKCMKSMKDCGESSSSSSESSESSDSDCEEEVVNMKTLQRMVPTDSSPASSTVAQTFTDDVKLQMLKSALATSTEIHRVPNYTTECSSMTDIPALKASMMEAKLPPPPPLSAVTVTGDRIEVCMGGKCKKSGAPQLMQEFTRHIGSEGVVVGCKCMGKCKEGPNVRIVNQLKEEEALVTKPRNPLCIGVGLEDVGNIVSNYLGERTLGSSLAEF